tara:strand:- start:3840 stop:5081 length:1242 start_codon:yes stop_codon:yes gene_type:complete
MNINIDIDNIEDIEYLSKLNEKKFIDVLKIAISIGLKSIQMSEVNMDCHSYITPIKELIDDSVNENKDKILSIDDKLNELLYIRGNSSRKGKLSEELCIRRLIQQYPDWEFKDVTYVGHEGDCRCISPYGEILYEFKSYDSNVNKEQIIKFYNDLDTTGIKIGIFISNTSGIVGKKDLEWEIINNDTLIIYISNMGFNGHGCIMATELLIALMNNDILNKNKWLYNENLDKEEIYTNLLENISEYKKNNELIYKLKKHVKEYRYKLNSTIDIFESEILEILLNSELIYKKIIGIVDNIKNEKQIISKFNIKDYILKNKLNKKNTNLLNKLYKILINLNIEILLKNNDWILIKDNDTFGFVKILKSKLNLQLIFNNLIINNFNINYEEYKNNKLIIHIDNDNNELWDLIINRIS